MTRLQAPTASDFGGTEPQIERSSAAAIEVAAQSAMPMRVVLTPDFVIGSI
jgi:hypothetical protein